MAFCAKISWYFVPVCSRKERRGHWYVVSRRHDDGFIIRMPSMSKSSNYATSNMSSMIAKSKIQRTTSAEFKGFCRSTSAKPADKRSPQQRTSQVHRGGSRIETIPNLFTNYNFMYLNICFNIHSLIYIYGYVVDTCPLTTHTCNLCGRYVVATYRPITFISCKSTYPIVVLVN